MDSNPLDLVQHVYIWVQQLHRTVPPATTNQSLTLTLATILLPGQTAQTQTQALNSLVREKPECLRDGFPPERLVALLSAPPANDICLQLLVNFVELFHMLQKVPRSHFEALHDLPPVTTDGSYADQEAFLRGLCKVFSGLSHTKIQEVKNTMTATSTNGEYKVVRELIPTAPPGHTNMIRSVFRMPCGEILALKGWLMALQGPAFNIVLRLIGMDSLELGAMYHSLGSVVPQVEAPQSLQLSTFPGGSSTQDPLRVSGFGKIFGSVGADMEMDMPRVSLNSSWFDNMDGMLGTSFSTLDMGGPGCNADPSSSFSQVLLMGGQPAETTTNPPEAMQFSDPAAPHTGQGGGFSGSPRFPGDTNQMHFPDPVSTQIGSFSHARPAPMGRYALTIRRQPPKETVYQRILKPLPVVCLVEEPRSNENLYLDVVAIRDNNEDLVDNVLEGTKTVQIRKNTAQFSKLKLTQTSQMKGTFFRLKFLLKIYDGHEFHEEGSYVISNPIEVFSHSQYLSSAGKKKNPPPPVVKEILPKEGAVNCRVVILGNNFVKNPKLVVRFGTQPVVPEFHEQGTLICNVPSDLPPGSVKVAVANDTVHYCTQPVAFTVK